MEPHKIKTIEELKALARKSFQTLAPQETDRDKCSAAIALDSYAELLLLIVNLLKVSVAALDAEDHNVTNVDATSYAVKNVLEFATRLIPLEEAELLDEVYAMVMGEGD